MCGIFGIINYGSTRNVYELNQIKTLTEKLLIASEERGRSASGVCLVAKDKARVYKNNVPGSKLLEEEGFKNLINNEDVRNDFRYVIGHTRFPTKGDARFNVNNHPIIVEKVIGVHNGVISNDDALFGMDASLKRIGLVDSEIIFQLINSFMNATPNLVTAAQKASKAMTGDYHVAFIHTDYKRYVTLFTGPSICLINNKSKQIMAFASSMGIIKRSIQGFKLFEGELFEQELKYNQGLRIDTCTGKGYIFECSRYDRSKSGDHLSSYNCEE